MIQKQLIAWVLWLRYYNLQAYGDTIMMECNTTLRSQCFLLGMDMFAVILQVLLNCAGLNMQCTSVISHVNKPCWKNKVSKYCLRSLGEKGSTNRGLSGYQYLPFTTWFQWYQWYFGPNLLHELPMKLGILKRTKCCSRQKKYCINHPNKPNKTWMKALDSPRFSLSGSLSATIWMLKCLDWLVDI